MPLSDDVNVDKISAISHGYVGADLEYLKERNEMFEKIITNPKFEEEKIPPETLDKLIVNHEDFQKPH